MSTKTRKLVFAAAFIAIAVILGNLPPIFITPNSKLSFVPLIVMFAGSMLGPLWGAAVGGAADFLNAFIGGKTLGTYFPGFTVTMALYGLLAGLLLHQKAVWLKNDTGRTVVAVVIVQTICSLLINSMWNSMLYGTPYPVMIGMRAPTTYLVCAIYVVLLCVMQKGKAKIAQFA